MSEIQTVKRPRPMAGHVAIAPIVLEIGELPEPLRDHQEYVTPYGLGATVSERAAVALKGFHYVTMQAIIAWEEAQ